MISLSLARLTAFFSVMHLIPEYTVCCLLILTSSERLVKSLSTRLHRAMLVFEVAGDDELGTSIFEDEEEEAAEGDAEATTRAVDPAVSATSSDDDDGPDPTTSTSRGPIEQVTQASSVAHEETPDLVEEEVTSTREAPRHIQRRHPPQQMLGDLERVTRSKVTSIAGFAHLAFVASFEPKDVGHAFF